MPVEGRHLPPIIGTFNLVEPGAVKYQVSGTYHTTATTDPPPPCVFALHRKIYRPRPPPHWKKVWDHRKHYDMHYGDGMRDEAIKQARKEAIKEGAFEYRSPLGPGFTFSEDGAHNNYNPYSKAVQGPRTVTFEYSEAYLDAQSNRESLRKRERVVEDLHGRRDARLYAEQMRRQQQRYNSAFARNPNDCVIL